MTKDVKLPAFRTLRYFLKTYPLQNLLVVSCLLLAGFAEMLGIGALLPLIGEILGDGAQSSNPGTLGAFVDSAFFAVGIEPSLKVLLFMVVAAITTKAVVLFFTMRYVSHVASDISRVIRMRFMAALMHAKWPYYNTLVTGHIANAISEQAQRAGFCYMMAGKTVASLLQISIYVAFAFLVSVEVTILAAIAGIILAVLFKTLVQASRRAGEAITHNMDAMSATFNESLCGVKSIKAMGQEERFMNLLRRDVGEVYEAQKKQHSATLLLQMCYEPAIVFILSCGLYYLMMFTDISRTNMLLLAFLFYRLLTYISVAQRYYQHVVQMESALWSLERQTVAAEDQAENLKKGKKPRLEKEISFKGVDVTYDGKNYLFKNLSEKIPAHKITLLFGPSGIGKTTLTDAILGMHQPTQGEIFIDDLPLSKADIKKWRSMSGYVPQETFLFHGTIAHNVTLGDPRYTKKQVEQALKDAAAWDFVKELKDGVNTVVGERGGRLSGGQRQRVALARSIIGKPSLLILDEATSGLDRDTEKVVMAALKKLKKKTTIIFISHNPDMKKFADKVISLQ